MANYDVIIILPYCYQKSDLENMRGQVLQQGSLGAGFLSSSLEGAGIKNYILDIKSEEILNDTLIHKIRISGCKIIAISVLAQIQFDVGIQVAECIKSANINVHITMGGHFPTLCCDNILHEFTCIDSIICGEGEYSIIALFQAIKNNMLFKKMIPGVRYRDMKGSIKGSKEIININHIDRLPYPTIPFVEKLIESGNRVNIMAGRGCNENCTYCTIPAFRKNKCRKVHSPEYVLHWMKDLSKKYGVCKFNFIDDVFCDKNLESIEWIEQFVKLIKQNNLRVDFSISLKSKRYNEMSITLLKEVGLTQVFIGVESAANRILKIYGRKETIEEIDQVIAGIQRLGITVIIGFIFFDPYVSWNELKSNYQWLLKHHFYSDHFFNVLKPYYGTWVRELLQNHGDLIESSCFECGNFIFKDSKVEILYNKLKVYENIYAKVNYNVLKLLYIEKSKRNTIGNIYKNKVNELYRIEAEIWSTLVGQLIESVDSNKNLVNEQMLTENLKKLNCKIDEYKSLLCSQISKTKAEKVYG